MEANPTNTNDVNFFAVSPKEDCPHQETLQYGDISYALTRDTLTAPCKNCQSTQENWVCLTCNEIFCSRYSNSHMIKHNEESKHPVALSLSDGSFWCYACDSYVYSKQLQALAIKFSKLKFPESKGGMLDLDVLAKEFAGIDASLRVEEKEEAKNFSRTSLVQGLRNKTFKKIIFLTGAGISVSAGIPDFRSETGLYAQLGECNLPYPEAIFEIGYFKEHPETFYKLAKVLMNYKAKPTLAHYFIKMLADLGLLQMNFTQNVDGLEVEAGLDLKYLIEAHGHIRSAHCAKCQKEKSIDELKQHIQEGKIYKCECSGPVKPDIIFFGEQLPANFFLSFQKIAEADLVVVMGTSLRVFPFASLVQAVPKEVPVVLINREDTGISREKFLFLQGDIDEIIGELVKELGWENHMESLRSKL